MTSVATAPRRVAGGLASAALVTALAFAVTSCSSGSDSDTQTSSQAAAAAAPSAGPSKAASVALVVDAEDSASHLAEDAAVLLASGGPTPAVAPEDPATGETLDSDTTKERREPISEPLAGEPYQDRQRARPYSPSEALLDAVVEGSYPTDPRSDGFVQVIGNQGLVTVLDRAGRRSVASVCYDTANMMFYTVRGTRCLPQGRA